MIKTKSKEKILDLLMFFFFWKTENKLNLKSTISLQY